MSSTPSMSAGLDRRQFLRGMSAWLAAGMLPARRALAQTDSASGPESSTLPHRPNIVLIITDQERNPQWWPEGWADDNLRNRKRLKESGLVFNRAYCNSAMCTPSRVTLFTGLYPAQHGAVDTLSFGGSASEGQPFLPLDLQNMATMLTSAGYEVHYRGKWHLSKAADGGEPTAEDVAAYGFQGWDPPDAGQDAAPENFGGGCANHDERFATDAADFLLNVAPKLDKPFALIVSLANPHDVLAYPRSWDAQDAEDPNCLNYQSDAPECFAQGISLPPTYDEDLANNYKPTAHDQLRTFLAAAIGPLTGPVDPQRYVNFYAFLQKEVDQHIGTVLDALAANQPIYENTFVIHTSDHGEMGLSHGGLRQKSFNVYEETVNVPLVISHPTLFTQRVETDALASLIDLMPTIATLADVPDRDQWTFLGRDLTPIIEDAIDNPGNPTVTVQESILFTFDDENMGVPNGQNAITQPNHIRCLIEDRWKFAMYYDPTGSEPPQYELYDRVADPEELHNKAHPDNTEHYDADKVAEMAQKLAVRMQETGTLPYNLHLPHVSG